MRQTSTAEKEDDFQEDQRCQYNQVHMASVRRTETENEAYSRAHSLDEAAGRHFRLIDGHNSCSGDYLLASKMDI